MAVAICPIHAQHANNFRLPQRDANEGELLEILRRGVEIMAGESCAGDRMKILESDDEEAARLYLTFFPMSGINSGFCSTEGMHGLIQNIRKAAGLTMGPHDGFAPELLAKIALNSVRLQDSAIMLMADKARLDDRAFAPSVYISRPKDFQNAPQLELNRERLLPLLRRGVEIMAGKECEGDRNRILEIEDERDALDYVMYESTFRSRSDRWELAQKIQEIEKFDTGVGAANLLLSNVILNSVRLQESAMLLIAYEVRFRDRGWALLAPPLDLYQVAVKTTATWFSTGELTALAPEGPTCSSSPDPRARRAK
jgi:hypothetical protein